MSSNAFHYDGTLEETSLAEMLWTVYRHKVPGVLEVTHEGISKRIYIADGNVLHASSTDRTDRLGAYLYRTGRLDREQLVETMREREASGKRHGELLIESGLMSPADLYESIRGQMESIVWSLFSWPKGGLVFRIGEHPEGPMIKIHLPLRQVIVRGIKKAQDPKALVARLGKKSTVFRPAYGAEDLIEIALGSEEYELLCLVDGERSLYDICTHGPYGASENARLMYAFRVLHLIEPDETSTDGVKIRYPTSS